MVIENGPIAGNPIGHTAIAVTGGGTYSFGNGTDLGSSVADYLAREANRRNTDLYIIKTTSQQDLAVVEYYKRYKTKGLPGDYFSIALGDNCATRSNGGMDAGGVPPYGAGQSSGNEPPVWAPPSMPGTAGYRAANAGAKHIRFPQHSKNLPGEISQFEPKPKSNGCLCGKSQ